MSVILNDSASSVASVTIAHPDGNLDVPSDVIMHFTEALWGFPGRREYVLLPAERRGMWWLMSVGADAVTFVLADPFVVSPSYGIDLGDTERIALEITDPNDVMALVVVALPAAPGAPATANFRAPIVFNLAAHRATQIISRDDAHLMQQPIEIGAFPRTEGGASLG